MRGANIDNQPQMDIPLGRIWGIRKTGLNTYSLDMIEVGIGDIKRKPRFGGSDGE